MVVIYGLTGLFWVGMHFGSHAHHSSHIGEWGPVCHIGCHMGWLSVLGGLWPSAEKGSKGGGGVD